MKTSMKQDLSLQPDVAKGFNDLRMLTSMDSFAKIVEDELVSDLLNPDALSSSDWKKLHDDVEDLEKDYIRTLAQRVGVPIDDAQLFWFLPAMTWEGEPILPEQLYRDAIQQFVRDISENAPEATAVRSAYDREQQFNSRTNAVKARLLAELARQYLHLFPKNAFSPRDINGHFNALIEETEPYQKAKSLQLLAQKHTRKALETWARRYWPDEIQHGNGSLPDPTPSDKSQKTLPQLLAPIQSGNLGNIAAGLSAISPSFDIHTSQEMDMFLRSACDGPKGLLWRNESQMERRVYEVPSASHRVEISRYDDPNGEALAWELMEKLTSAQDSDFPLMALYVCGILAPPKALPENRLAAAWIDLDDVMERIGWLAAKPTKAEREELRKKLWVFICFGSRAVVTGRRTGAYVDRHTGKEIPTQIESAPWKIMSNERPLQDSLFMEDRPAPVRVYLAISKEWEELLTHRDLAQYLPLGELLGAIPPNQVAGDWARSIGLCLARLWRWRSRETVAGQVNPTRREILTHYTPKTKTVEEYLDGDNPKRAVEYYREALNILLENGLISPVGDAAKEVTTATMLAPYGRQGWAKAWLEGVSGLLPGDKWKPAVIKQAAALPPLKPRDLKARTTRGRKMAKKSS